MRLATFLLALLVGAPAFAQTQVIISTTNAQAQIQFGFSGSNVFNGSFVGNGSGITNLAVSSLAPVAGFTTLANPNGTAGIPSAISTATLLDAAGADNYGFLYRFTSGYWTNSATRGIAALNPGGLSLAGTTTPTNGVSLHTNSYQNIPPFAPLYGGALLVNSNGTPYVIMSSPNSTTWSATNAVGVPSLQRFTTNAASLFVIDFSLGNEQFFSTNNNVNFTNIANIGAASSVPWAMVSISNASASSITISWFAGVRQYGANATTSATLPAGKVWRSNWNVDPQGTNMWSALQNN